ncbi:aldehyde dehydrogenase family protein [Janibacter alittae]|uniref:Aldehyde dehydrogenase family protein n=1 Tax=Janibacter alittae TaxID=3115209 RepID=A0ABZ2MKS4_9MICO
MSTDTIHRTNAERAEQIVTRARDGADNWARQTPADRRAMLMKLVELVDAHAEEWVRRACRIKGLDPSSPLAGEEWTSGPWATMYYARALAETLERMEQGRGPTHGFDIRPVTGDRVAVEVLPHSIWDRLLLSGLSAEVWCEPGVSEQQVRDTAGLGARNPQESGGTCVVLGAGNILSIAPLDALYALYADNRSVAVKLNPVTDPLLPVLQAVFAPFVEIGAVQFFSSDLDLGSRVIEHEGIDAVHLTGAETTHDAIVWGSGEEGERNRAAGTPKLTKPVTSELGGISPIIVVPGQWSQADLQFQAEHVATMRLHNAGCNCIAGQVLVLSADWAQKEEFLDLVRQALVSAPDRPGWYPGLADRVAAARESYATSEAVGGSPERTLITGLPGDGDSQAYSSEYFGPVLAVTEVPGTGEDFLRTAVDFANERLHGTLGANVLIHPDQIGELGHDRFERLLAELRYGTIAVNAWTGVGFLLPLVTWGAFPGHTLEDVQSGRGVVHNGLLLAHAERTVVRGPWRPFPRSIAAGEMSLTPVPPWFVHNRTAATTGRRLVRFVAEPGLTKLPGVFASALRG